MSMDWINTIELRLGKPLPEDLKNLYLRGDGEPENEDVDMRLMSAEEVFTAFDTLKEHVDLSTSCCPFWTASGNDYGLVYLEGPLVGKVYFLDNDLQETAVAYRSAKSFEAAKSKAIQKLQKRRDSDEEIEEDYVSYFELPTDYYVYSEYYRHGKARRIKASASEKKKDEAIIAELEKSLRDYQGKQETGRETNSYSTLAFNIMSMAYPDMPNTVTQFLNSENMWVSAYACDVLGHWKAAWAIQQLAHIVQSGEDRPNARMSAIDALGRIGTPEAKEVLTHSLEYLDIGYQGHVQWALKRIASSGT